MYVNTGDTGFVLPMSISGPSDKGFGACLSGVYHGPIQWLLLAAPIPKK